MPQEMDQMQRALLALAEVLGKRPLAISHTREPLATLALADPVDESGGFDDSEMTTQQAEAWKEIIGRYPSAAGRVRSIRSNPNLDSGGFLAQWLPSGVMEVSPNVTPRELPSLYIHELMHALGITSEEKAEEPARRYRDVVR